MEREIVLTSYSIKNKDNNKPENFVRLCKAYYIR